MSRNSLRRNLFHQNLDRLLQDSALRPVQEEGHNTSDYQNVVDDLGEDAVKDQIYTQHQPGAATEDQVHTEHQSDTFNLKSPIYRPKPQMGTTARDKRSTERPLSEYENGCPDSPIYVEPWSPATPRLGRAPAGAGNAPSADMEKPQCKRKAKAAIPSLIFQYPDLNNNNAPLTPLSSGPLHSSTPHWSGTPSPSCGRDGVKALPMSPALFIAQQAATPGPSDEDFQDPMCQTIREHSIFSQPECNMCRICHEDGSREKLVSPCHCTGTMGMLHMTCLEKWLGSSNTTKCEICQFQFKVLRKRHPFKWYLQEPSLHEDRRVMVKDVSLMVTVSLLVTLISVLCLTFAAKLVSEGKTVPAIILIIVASLAIIAYCIWMGVISRRMHHLFAEWNETHHTVQIKQSDELDSSDKSSRTFPKALSKKIKGVGRSTSVERDLQSSTYISYSLESYKAAMFNPITPSQPLLDNPGDITNLDEDSPSVMCLDDEDTLQASVCYYQPPQTGQTSMLYSETGRLLRETGV